MCTKFNQKKSYNLQNWRNLPLPPLTSSGPVTLPTPLVGNRPHTSTQPTRPQIHPMQPPNRTLPAGALHRPSRNPLPTSPFPSSPTRGHPFTRKIPQFMTRPRWTFEAQRKRFFSCWSGRPVPVFGGGRPLPCLWRREGGGLWWFLVAGSVQLGYSWRWKSKSGAGFHFESPQKKKLFGWLWQARHRRVPFVTDCDGSVTISDKFLNCDGVFRHKISSMHVHLQFRHKLRWK